MNEEGPQTLVEAVRYFSDKKICHGYMIQIKWPDGKITCPKCGGEKIWFIQTREIYKCGACKKQFSAKVDTIFEFSQLGLDKWFVAVWLIANAKNDISSLELHRALGVTQKTAWFMLHRIRLAMKTGHFRKLKDVVESDETFVGGAAANMHAAKRERDIRGRGAVGKTVVHGLLERGTEDDPSQVHAIPWSAPTAARATPTSRSGTFTDSSITPSSTSWAAFTPTASKTSGRSSSG